MAGECVGDRNVQAVTHFLNMNGIRLVQSEVGGTRGRKLVFHTDDGRGLVGTALMGIGKFKSVLAAFRGHTSRRRRRSLHSGNGKRSTCCQEQFHASAEPCQISTILGSCVAICLWDSRLRAGGMNHFLLPASREGQPASQRFADVATQRVARKVECARLPACTNLRAKIFGGAAMFQNQNRYAVSLGAQNVAAALHLMKSAGIPVVAQETGGTHGRKIIFNTDDGVAWCQRV